MGKAFAALAEGLAPTGVNYHAFDFHRECSRMRWDRLSLLLAAVEADRRAHGFSLARSAGSGLGTGLGSGGSEAAIAVEGERDGLVRRQNGVMRTNCIDCLDRTNVVQSMLARLTLVEQLAALGVLPAHSTAGVAATHHGHGAPGVPAGAGTHDGNGAPGVATEHRVTATAAAIEGQLVLLDSIAPHLADALKHLWADHADECSRQYAGSPALKSDFTRTGKRTPRGVLNDGYHAATRYIYNNFLDGGRQDAYDLILGNAEGTPRVLR